LGPENSSIYFYYYYYYYYHHHHHHHRRHTIYAYQLVSWSHISIYTGYINLHNSFALSTPAVSLRRKSTFLLYFYCALSLLVPCCHSERITIYLHSVCNVSFVCNLPVRITGLQFFCCI
jgi:hypothetical protein